MQIKNNDFKKVKLNMKAIAITKIGQEMEGSTCQGSEAISIIMPFISVLNDFTGAKASFETPLALLAMQL